jgi:Leucine-rich repeat (LRR) protein
MNNSHMLSAQGVSCPIECVRAGISKMKEFFRKIVDCVKSAEIDLSEYDFYKFPTDMKCIDFLQKLSVKLNKIEVIPKVFEQYQDLLSLDLSNNRIKLLPSSLSVLTGLETLDVSNNLLESLPCELYNIPEIRRFMQLDYVGITDTVAFKWAGNESTLYDPPKEIVGFGFEQLPMILKYLKHIFLARKTKTIMIVDVPLTKFPRTWVENDSSWAKIALTSLQISGTKLQELPHTISCMSNLKSLILTRNFLEILPASIGM